MKTNGKTWLRAVVVCAAIGGAAVLGAGCAGVAYTEPGTGVYYGYYYYPDEDIYYYPDRHVYYWNEGGAWHWGADLPPSYRIRGEHREYLRLHSEQPWTEHREYENHEEHEEHEHDGGAYHYERRDHD